jgi:hypothetical protein
MFDICSTRILSRAIIIFDCDEDLTDISLTIVPPSENDDGDGFVATILLQGCQVGACPEGKCKNILAHISMNYSIRLD